MNSDQSRKRTNDLLFALLAEFMEWHTGVTPAADEVENNVQQRLHAQLSTEKLKKLEAEAKKAEDEAQKAADAEAKDAKDKADKALADSVKKALADSVKDAQIRRYRVLEAVPVKEKAKTEHKKVETVSPKKGYWYW